MIELTYDQILYIENDLKSKGLNERQLKNEILDHICCQVENELNKNVEFPQAYDISLKSFDDKEFKNLKSQIGKHSPSGKFINSKILTSGIAACILMFTVVVDARDIPDIHPVGKAHQITSGFGARIEPIFKKKKFHNGIDIRAAEGTVVKATADGIILTAKKADNYGIHIIIKHDGHYETMYAHLSRLDIKSGDVVKKGQQIALSGNTGLSTAPHLHYEVLKDGKHVDPTLYINPE